MDQVLKPNTFANVKLFRHLRVLEYIGSLEAINLAIEGRTVKGQRIGGAASPETTVVIRESFIGEAPTVVNNTFVRQMVKAMLSEQQQQQQPCSEWDYGYRCALQDVLDNLPL